MSTDEFRQLCGFWATGVTVVTTCDREGRCFGLTINSVTSLSLDPPKLLVCIDNNSVTLPPLREAGKFCINVLSETQKHISHRFACKGTQKFADISYSKGRLGTPVLEGSLVAFECRVHEVIPSGDHQILIGLLDNAIVGNEEAKPLIFYKGEYAS